MPNYLSRMKPNGANGTEYKLKDEELREVVQNMQGEVTEVDTPNSTPFLYRETPYEADRVFLDELVGGSVAWNQLVQNGNFVDTSGWQARNSSTISVNSGVCTVTPGSANSLNIISFPLPVKYRAGHKILVNANVKSSASIRITMQNNGLRFSKYSSASGNWESVCGIYNSVENEETLCFANTTNTNAYDIKNVYICDLTQMFGTTIADYVYSLEQATAGSGIAWLKSHGFFTKDYYPYNAGELISVKASGKKYVGFNQWDEEWENGLIDETTGVDSSNVNSIRSKNYIQVYPNTVYYAKIATWYRVCYYDKSKTFISGTQTTTNMFTTPDNAYFIRFCTNALYGTTYNHDICINISKTEGTPKNGDYVPYEEHTYDISNIDLRGIPKLVNNELVYDGDTYESDGNVTRKYGIVDLGTLDWVYVLSSGVSPYFSANKNDAKQPQSIGAVVSNILCSIYTAVVRNPSSFVDKCVVLDWTGYNAQIQVKDLSYTDATAFKTAVSGVYLIYELATPTTEQLTPFTNPQICDKDGTEEFIDNRTVPVPVGHNSTYANLPSMMDGDFLNYMAKNFASEDYVDRAVEGKADNTTAYVDLPGNYDTTNKNFPTRSAISGSVENCLTYINDLADKLYTAINSHATALANIPTKTVVVDHRAIDVGDEFNISLPLSYKFLIIELTIILTDELCYGSIVSTDFANGSVLSIVANGHGLSYWCDLSRMANRITVDGNFDSAHGELTITAF